MTRFIVESFHLCPGKRTYPAQRSGVHPAAPRFSEPSSVRPARSSVPAGSMRPSSAREPALLRGSDGAHTRERRTESKASSGPPPDGGVRATPTPPGGTHGCRRAGLR
jgi:hypothetical protein